MHLFQIQDRIDRCLILCHLKVQVAAFLCIVLRRLAHIAEHRSGFYDIALRYCQLLQLSIGQTIAISHIQYKRRPGLFIDVNGFHDALRRSQYLIADFASEYERRIILVLIQGGKIHTSVHAVIHQ